MARTRAAHAADVLRMVFSGADSVVVAIYDHTTDIVAALAEDGTLIWYTPPIFTRSHVAEDHRVAFNAVDGLLHDLIGNPAIGEALPLAQPLLDPQVSSKIGVFGDLHRVLSLRPGGYEATAAASS